MGPILFLKIENSEKIVTVVTIKGNINSDTKDKLSELLSNIKNNSTNYIFLIEGLDYISSSGIGAFIEFYEIVNDRGGKICFVGMNATVRRIFDYMGFLTFYYNLNSLDDALNEIKK